MKAEMISEAVDSFMKAKDASRFTEVIAAAQEGNFYQDLVRYLVMARDESKVFRVYVLLLGICTSQHTPGAPSFFGALLSHSIGHECTCTEVHSKRCDVHIPPPPFVIATPLSKLQ